MELVEKFMNGYFIATHTFNLHNNMHEVTTYNREKGEFITRYETDNDRYAHLRFIQSVMNFLN